MWSGFIERTGVVVVGAVVIVTLIIAELANVAVWIISLGVQVIIQFQVVLVYLGCLGGSDKCGSEVSFHLNLLR